MNHIQTITRQVIENHPIMNINTVNVQYSPGKGQELIKPSITCFNHMYTVTGAVWENTAALATGTCWAIQPLINTRLR